MLKILNFKPLQNLCSILLILTLVTGILFFNPLAVYARTNCNNTSISDLTLYDDGSVKSFVLTYDWNAASSDYQYFAIFDEHSPSEFRGNTSYWYFYDGYGTTSIAQGVNGFASKYNSNNTVGKTISCYSYTTEGVTSIISPECKATLNFQKGAVKNTTSQAKSFSVVLFIDQGKTGSGYRPTDPVGILTLSPSGDVSYHTEGKDDTQSVTPQAPKFTVTFYSNNGRGVMLPAEVTQGDSYPLPICLFRPPLNHQFNGWSYTSSGDIIETDSITPTGNVNLYARWIPHQHSKKTIKISNLGITKTYCECGYYMISFE